MFVENFFVEVFSRRYKITCTQEDMVYHVECKKFKNMVVVDKEKKAAIEQIRNLIEARVRILLRDVIGVIDEKAK